LPRRLSRTCVNELIENGEYELQKKLLQNRINTLVIPEMDVTINAGALLENLGVIWANASMGKKYRLLTIMLDAVYLDLLATCRVVGILPKPIFYPLFETEKQRPEAKITKFKPDDEKDYHHAMVGLVETE
jgi:hypothetical protein